MTASLLEKWKNIMGRKRKRNRQKINNNKDTKMPITTTTYKKVECHTGHHPIVTWFDDNDAELGTLYAGGWTRGANPPDDWVVIDLAGGGYSVYGERIDDQTGGLFPSTAQLKGKKQRILHLGIRDYDIPDFSVKFWKNFGEEVASVLQAGDNILVACTGGHGRTGLVVAILSAIFLEEARTEPVKWLRTKYCHHVVETIQQEDYVQGVVNALFFGGSEDFYITPDKWQYSYTNSYDKWGYKDTTNKQYDTKGNLISYTMDDIDPYEGLQPRTSNNWGYTLDEDEEETVKSIQETYEQWVREESQKGFTE